MKTLLSFGILSLGLSLTGYCQGTVIHGLTSNVYAPFNSSVLSVNPDGGGHGAGGVTVDFKKSYNKFTDGIGSHGIWLSNSPNNGGIVDDGIGHVGLNDGGVTSSGGGLAE